MAYQLGSTLRMSDVTPVLVEHLGLDTQHKRARFLGVVRETVLRWEKHNAYLPQAQANLARIAPLLPASEDGAILDQLPGDSGARHGWGRP